MFRIEVEIDLIKYDLDLSEDVQIEIDYKVEQVERLKERFTSSTKNITIPATDHNKFVFANIHDLSINISFNTLFNPALRTACTIYKNEIPVLVGFLKITSYKNNNGIETFEIVVIQKTEDLFTKIKDKKLSDLDISELNHIYSENQIIYYMNNYMTSNVVYPCVDKGFGLKAENILTPLNILARSIKLQQLTPAVTASYILRKIFKTQGYNLRGSIFDDPNFKNLIYVGCDQTIKNRDINDKAKSFYVGKTTQQLISYPYVTWGKTAFGTIVFDDEANNFSDTNNLFNSNIFTAQYNSDDFGQSFTVSATVAIQNVPDAAEFNYDLWCTIYREFDPTTGVQSPAWNTGTGFAIPFQNNTTILGQDTRVKINTYNSTQKDLADDQVTKLPVQVISGGATVNRSGIKFSYTSDVLDNRSPTHRPLYPGERVRVVIHYVPFPVTVSGTTYSYSSLFIAPQDTTFRNNIDPVIYKNMTMYMNNVLSQEMTQEDYINSIIQMYNLIIDVDRKDSSTFILETRDNYYKTDIIKDWSDKILTSEYNTNFYNDLIPKFLNFNFKEGKDYYSKLFKDSTSSVYGNFKVTNQTDWDTSSEDINIGFPSSTLVKLTGSDVNNLVYMPILAKEVDKNMNRPAGLVEDLPRLMLRKKVNVVAGYKYTFANQTFTYYPYAGELDDPYQPTFSMVFAKPPLTFFPTDKIWNMTYIYPTKNLGSVYYKNIVKKYNSLNTKELECYMLLTEADIANFSFRNKILIQTAEFGQQRYYVNSIVWDGEVAKIKLTTDNYE